MSAKTPPKTADFSQARERELHRSTLPKECLKVLQVTDTHLYADDGGRLLGVNTLDSFRSVIDTFLETGWQPDLILATGDLVHDATPRGYRQLAKLLDHFGVPVYCLPGNHDVPVIMRDHLQSDFVSCPRVVDHKGWRLILLDSTERRRISGSLDQSSLEWLESELRSNRECHHLVALHHQPVEVGAPWIWSAGSPKRI